MASMGERVRIALGEILEKKPESIQGTDKLIHYGYGRANFFSLFEEMEEKLRKRLQISDSDSTAMMAMKTVEDLTNLIEKILARG